MKKISKVKFILGLVLFFVLAFSCANINTLAFEGYEPPAEWPSDTSNLEIVNHDEEMRAIWVTPHVGDININKSNFNDVKKELLEVLNVLKRNHLNTIIFHLRVLNDAMYETNLAPVSVYTKFTNLNYLPWFIEKCHEFDIEFHAWLNPYRIHATGNDTKEKIANDYKDYPLNPASKVENIIKSTVEGQKGAILDPASPEVRQHVVAVCEELIKKYDIDAIHFDDYFYYKMKPADDKISFNKYKNPGEYLDDFRRRQVDILIRDLRIRINELNKELDRAVQLGISPTGVYRNSSTGKISFPDPNGPAVTNGSKTRGYAHYNYPLYADTKKWADENWIDYLIPQAYQGIGNIYTEYREMVRWWAHTFKNSKTNIYIGIGLYRKDGGGTSDGWGTDEYEFYKELAITDDYYPLIKGFAIFCYRSLVKFENTNDVKRLHNESRLSKPVVRPANESLIEKKSDPVKTIKTLNNINDEFMHLFVKKEKGMRAINLYIGRTDDFSKAKLKKVSGFFTDREYAYFKVKKDAINKYLFFEASSISGFKASPYKLTTDTTLDEYNGNIIDFDVSKIIFQSQTNFLIKFFKPSILLNYESSFKSVEVSYDKTHFTKININPVLNGNEYTLEFNHDKLYPNLYLKFFFTSEFGEHSTKVLDVFNRSKTKEEVEYFNNALFEMFKALFK